MRLRIPAAVLAFWLALPCRAAPSPDQRGTANLQPLEAKAAELFNARTITSESSDLATTCGNVLLCFQAVSATLIVAALLNRMRKEQTQMEGVAATLLKVGFIAIIPGLRDLVLQTADEAAAFVGYRSISASDAPASVARDVWQLLEQWVPPSTPHLDALETQAANQPPGSLSEQEWGLRAWNWARGVGVTDVSLFHGVWQAASGSARAMIVFTSCGVMVCCLSLTLMCAYIGEIARYLLFYGGCAMLPVFIAGLGLEVLQAQSRRAILALVSVAAWPVGWALANVVTHAIAQKTHTWMAETAHSALEAAGMPDATFAVATPYLAWGALFLFVGVTIAVCAWMLGCVFYAPILMNRAVTAGATAAAAVAESIGVSALTGAAGAARSFSGWMAPTESRSHPGAPRGQRTNGAATDVRVTHARDVTFVAAVTHPAGTFDHRLPASMAETLARSRR